MELDDCYCCACWRNLLFIPVYTTQTSPNLAMLGREVLLPCTLIAQPPHDTPVSTTYAATFRNNLRDAHQRVRASMHASARTQKRYFDARVKQHTFHVGQLVWMYWPLPRIRSTFRKLTKLWTGPWEILAFSSSLVVQVKHTTTRKRQTVHIDRLVPCASAHITEPPAKNQAAPVPHPAEHQTTPPHSQPDYSDSVVLPSDSPSTSVNLRSRRTLRPPARYRSWNLLLIVGKLGGFYPFYGILLIFCSFLFYYGYKSYKTPRVINSL